MANEEFLVRMAMVVRVEDEGALLAADAAARAARGDDTPEAGRSVEDALQNLLSFPPVADLPGCSLGSTVDSGDRSTWSASVAVDRLPAR